MVGETLWKQGCWLNFSVGKRQLSDTRPNKKHMVSKGSAVDPEANSKVGWF